MSRNPQGEPRTEAGLLIVYTAEEAQALWQRGFDAALAEAAAPVEGLRERGSDIRLLCDAILGGTSHLPHRDAADRVLDALRAIESPAHPEPGLDVERLARAIAKRDHELGRCPPALYGDLDKAYHTETSREEAAALLTALGEP